MRGHTSIVLHALFDDCADPLDLHDAVEALPPGAASAIHDFVTRLSPAKLMMLAPETRYLLLRRLGPAPVDATAELREKRDYAATLVLATQPFPLDHERFEEQWAAAMAAPLSARLHAFKAQHPVPTHNVVPLASAMAAEQARCFNTLSGTRWAQAPARIATFELGRDYFLRRYGHEAADVYPGALCFYAQPGVSAVIRYPALSDLANRMIAFNIHPDTGPHTPARIAYYTAHEVVHLFSGQALEMAERGVLPARQNPFFPFMRALSHERPLYSFVLKNFGGSVYRALMGERLSYSFSHKLHAMLRGRAHQSELHYMAADITTLRPAWGEKISALAKDLGLYDPTLPRIPSKAPGPK